MKSNNIKIGVLGGIGPEATSYFYVNFIDQFQKIFIPKNNTFFPNIIINSIPAPDLITVKKVTKDNLSFYYQGIKDLNKHNPDFIVMICNTIHLFYDEMQKVSKSRIINLGQLISKKIKGYSKNKICILGTFSSVKNNIYKIPENQLFKISDMDILIVTNLIENYNKGSEKEKQIKSFNKLLNKILKHKGVVVVLGCTELSLMNRSNNKNIISSLDIMVDEVINELSKIKKASL